jgi:hypothetical protein
MNREYFSLLERESFRDSPERDDESPSLIQLSINELLRPFGILETVCIFFF